MGMSEYLLMSLTLHFIQIPILPPFMFQSTGGELESTPFYYLRKDTAFRTQQHFVFEEEKDALEHVMAFM